MSTPVDNDYNLQEAWDRACTSFAQTAKVDLTTTPKNTIDQVLDQIRTKQDEDDERNNKYKTAKDVIGKTLNFVMVLGGIAAQGTNMVGDKTGQKHMKKTGADRFILGIRS